MNLVPAILYRTEDSQDDNGNERQARPKRIKVVEDTGVMFNDYDWKCHQFIAHLRRVHPANPPVTIALEGFEGKELVKAADPLAKPGIPLYYFHSKTKLYNDIFFHFWPKFWDKVMGPTFRIVSPWFTVNSKKALDYLFDLYFEK